MQFSPEVGCRTREAIVGLAAGRVSCDPIIACEGERATFSTRGQPTMPTASGQTAQQQQQRCPTHAATTAGLPGFRRRSITRRLQQQDDVVDGYARGARGVEDPHCQRLVGLGQSLLQSSHGDRLVVAVAVCPRQRAALLDEVLAGLRGRVVGPAGYWRSAVGGQHLVLHADRALHAARSRDPHR